MTTLALTMVLAALLIALLLVRASIGYAHRRGMLDQPGQRRSHSIPTARGGGIGIVAAVLLTVPVCLWRLPGAWPVNVIAGLAVVLLLVALVGWWDDHSNLPVLPRFGAQVLAVALFSVALLLAAGLSLLWWPLLVLAGAWSINLHNFMDGIDGLLAQQAIFVTVAFAALAGMAGQPALATACACVAAACAGFWVYNRSPARIFMGDVGSGSLGLLIFAFGAMLWRMDQVLLWPVLILCVAFVTDASLTLLVRMLDGRRWYTSHREHLYQWMVRRGHSHARAGTYYLIWNLFVAVPMAMLALIYPRMAMPVCIVAYAVTSAAWLALKRRYLRRAHYKVRHVNQ